MIDRDCKEYQDGACCGECNPEICIRFVKLEKPEDKIYECPRCNYIDLKENMKPMKDKVIFENEEEFDQFFSDCIERNLHADEILKDVKKYGYIRKDIVEEAEEMYSTLEVGMPTEHLINTTHKLYEALQCLKAENERLKNRKEKYALSDQDRIALSSKFKLEKKK